MLIDTHCHLTHQRYTHDWPSVLRRACEAGVGEVVSIASDLPDAGRIGQLMAEAGELTEEEAGSVAALHRTAGVHPHQADEAPNDLRDRLLEALAEAPVPVAVGECGLDYHYDLSPRERQRRVFDVHLEVAAEVQRPVVVHCRDAEREMEAFVRDAGSAGVVGVLHCYPGDLSLLEAAMEEGWYVSFTGLVTFSSYEGDEAVRRVPAGRYMLETDGPYMAPVPHRGQRNEPAWVPRIRDRVAELRNETPEAVEADTTGAARRFFGI